MSIKKIDYLIRNIDPLTFAEQSSDTVLFATKNFVPGSAVRGALATQYMRQHKLQEAHLDQGFHDLFLSGKVKFLPAYPIGNELLKEGQPFVLPLSLMKSKNGKKIKDYSSACKMEVGYKKMTGFAVWHEGKLYPVAATTKIEFHMSRSGDRERICGSSKDQNIFNYEYIEPGQIFKGSFIIEDSVAEAFVKEIQNISAGILYLGRSRNAQYGKCDIELLPSVEDAKPEAKSSLFLLAITPYVPYGEWQRTDEAVTELLGVLEKKLAATGIMAKFAKSGMQLFASAAELDGFVGVWHVKKAREKSLAAGSLIELKLENEAELDFTVLSDLLKSGFGKNTVEGFGQFILWMPFEKDPKLAEIPAFNNDIVIGSEVKSKCKAIMLDKLLAHLHQQAFEDAQKIRSNNSTSGLKVNMLKRIEVMMDSSNSMCKLQDKVRELKMIAEENLRGIAYDGNMNLYTALLADDSQQPYQKYPWAVRVGLKAADVGKLESDFGTDIAVYDKDVLYKEYWLWYMRHATKILKSRRDE